MSLTASLYLIPVPLSGAGVTQMSADAKSMAHQLNYFISERPKTSRKWIKDIQHPLPQSEITVIDIMELADIEIFNNMIATLNKGISIGLVSEAGMPCIADPGFELVSRLHSQGWEIKPLPGPNSMMMALMASGLPGQKFSFHGYLSAKKEELREEVIKVSKAAKTSGFTQIFMETPYRNKQVFTTLLGVCPQDLKLCVAADLGTKTEIIKTAKISHWKTAELNPFYDRPAIFILSA